MMDSLSRGIELAKTKHDLHAEINDLTEKDSVVLIIGCRFLNDEGKESSFVRMVERGTYGFETMGLLEVARNRAKPWYQSGDE